MVGLFTNVTPNHWLFERTLWGLCAYTKITWPRGVHRGTNLNCFNQYLCTSPLTIRRRISPACWNKTVPNRPLSVITRTPGATRYNFQFVGGISVRVVISGSNPVPLRSPPSLCG